VPAAVAAALQRALAKTPADRFNPVALFGEALGQRETAPVPTPAPTAPAVSSRRGRWLTLAGLAAVAVFVSVATTLWVTSGRLKHHRSRHQRPHTATPTSRFSRSRT